MYPTVYRKPTHTDQYLQWDSHHHLSAKYITINALTHRAKTVCNKLELIQKEMDHLRKALSHCKYPNWAMERVQRRFSQLISKGSNNANSLTLLVLSPPQLKPKPRVTLSYLTPRAYVEASRRSAVSMAYRPLQGH